MKPPCSAASPPETRWISRPLCEPLPRAAPPPSSNRPATSRHCSTEAPPAPAPIASSTPSSRTPVRSMSPSSSGPTRTPTPTRSMVTSGAVPPAGRTVTRCRAAAVRETSTSSNSISTPSRFSIRGSTCSIRTSSAPDWRTSRAREPATRASTNSITIQRLTPMARGLSHGFADKATKGELSGNAGSRPRRRTCAWRPFGRWRHPGAQDPGRRGGGTTPRASAPCRPG